MKQRYDDYMRSEWDREQTEAQRRHEVSMDFIKSK